MQKHVPVGVQLACASFTANLTVNLRSAQPRLSDNGDILQEPAMKLLLTSATCKSVYQKSVFLKSKGIAVYIANKRMAALKSAVHEGLWVVLDSQFEDALQLLHNPNHVVASPVSEEEMAAMEKNAKVSFSVAVNKFFSRLLFVFIVCLFIVFVLRMIFGSA